MAALTEEQSIIRDQAKAWVEEKAPVQQFRAMRDSGVPGRFRPETWAEIAVLGWAGMIVQEEYGGSGLGVTEAALMMLEVARKGGMTAASAIHMNIFGLNPVVVFGSDEQKKRMLPPLIDGSERACFAVTEPDTGLNTTRLKTRAEKRGKEYIVSGQKVWISTAQVAEKMLLLARTTPRDEVSKKTEGLSAFLEKRKPDWAN